MKILNLIPVQYRMIFAVAVLLAVVGCIFGAGWAVNGWRLEAQIADLKAAHAEQVIQAQKATTKQVEAALEDTRIANLKAEEATNAARKKQDLLSAAVAASRRDRSLLDAARAYSAARACPAADTAGAAVGSQAGPVPDGMQDGDRILFVLGRLEHDAEEFALAAHRAREAGQLAEHLYEVNRQACSGAATP